MQIWNALNGKQALRTQGRGSFLRPKHHFSFDCIRGLKKQLYFLPTTFPLHRQRDTQSPVHTRALPAHGQAGRTRQGGTRVSSAPGGAASAPGAADSAPGSRAARRAPQPAGHWGTKGDPLPSVAQRQGHQRRGWQWKPGRLRNRVFSPPLPTHRSQKK